VAISLFLGFHNNASYARWWEARNLWGTQLIAVRNLIRFLLTICHNGRGSAWTNGRDVENNSSSNKAVPLLDDSDWRVRVILLAMAQTHALRAQLRPYCRSDRPTTAVQDRDRYLTPEQKGIVSKSPNPASACLALAATILGEESNLSEFSLIHASELIDHLCAIQAGCERIQSTPLPFVYSLLVHRTAYVYVFLAPFAMASSMGWWTPIFTGMLAYTFFGLDEVARQIQEPFRDEPQCLALSAICRTIEIDVCEALRRDVPPPLEPVNAVLM
jgi:putative membrane protein